MNNKKVRNNIKLNKFMIVFAFFCFALILARTSYLALSNKVDGIDMKVFAKNRSTSKRTLYANRGTIYDSHGEILAENTSSYTLIAYLDPSRSKNSKTPKHVEDVNYTAKQLATVLDMTEKQIKSYLNQKGKYQVELGPKAKGLTELKKEAIEKLNLPGIDFVESIQRYYPNGEFAAYVLGYAKKNDDGLIKGELGIEQLYNKDLSGTDGYVEYQKDRNGYQIPNTKEIREEAVAGNDIYLTLDGQVQFFVEQALNAAYTTYKPEWMVMVVADAKTGKILADSSRPSFNPNTLNIKNYYDLSISYPYEPGSTMKIYTYMAAMEKGTYKGDKTYKSGSYKVDKDTTIKDWNNGKGFGTITYDQGLAASSNVGIINILNNFIDGKDLKAYLTKMGFGSATNVGMANESKGSLGVFTYATDVYTKGFGQGIQTTPMQHIRALTAIANDGVMLQPYIIDKVVDSKSGEVLVQNKRTELDRVASKETTDKIKELMYMVINGGSGSYATGTSYKVKGYDIIGKTGTAQIFNNKTGKYSTSSYDTIKSVSLMFPKDNPQVIIYAAAKRTNANALYTSVKKVIKNTANYMNINNKEVIEEKDINYTQENFINRKTEDVVKNLTEKKIKYVLIGDGDKIINQYPKKDNIVNTNEHVFLLTSGTNYKMPNIKNYSLKEVLALTTLLDIDVTVDGTGYVKSYNIKDGTLITKDTTLEVKLETLYSEA